MFNISIQSEESVITVILEGRFDTVNSNLFNEEIRSLLEEEEYIIIDFRGCNYLCSSGIRSLLAAEKKLKAKGGALMLTGMTAEVLQVVEITGLNNVFHLISSIKDAHDEVSRLKNSKSVCFDTQAGNHHFHFRQFETTGLRAKVWQESGIAGYDELGISAGLGSPAESLAEDEKNRGLFFTLGNCCGYVPFDKTISPDYRVVHHAASGGVFVHWAVSYGQHPAGMVRLQDPSGITPDLLADSVLQVAGEAGHVNLKALVIADYNSQGPSLSLVCLVNEDNQDRQGTFYPDQLTGHICSTGKGKLLFGAKFLLNNLPPVLPEGSFSEYLKDVLTIDNIEGIGVFDLTAGLTAPVVWFFGSDGWVEADSQRIKVETGEDFIFEPYKAFLARRLYHDSALLVIHQLHGGYSAQTFHVDSFDHAGRKLRPTVLKISSRALITREADRCRCFSLPYIMNNSAIILGTAFYGDTGALRYNFVGIGGEQTQLKWLTHYFNTWPEEKLEPLFDKIFTQILKPWYGQPVRERIYPFRDHDPTWTFFPRLCETAEEILGIQANEEYFTAEETGQRLVNPYWFLSHEYEKRRDEGINYFTAICHGDLNMQNILLDDELNVYLIDFSETKPRSVISDFARLEAIFMVEKAPLESDDDLKEMTEFVTRFYDSGRLDILSGNTWTGGNREIMNRNIAMILKMRQYAIDCSKGDGNMVPYYIAMLEWVLPIVCYTSLPLLHKKLSAYVAGLLCGKLITCKTG